MAGRFQVPIAAVSLVAVLAPAPVAAIVALPPEMVGPPRLSSDPRCPLQATTAGGKAFVPATPFPALAPGAPVDRNAISFATGGGGTSNATLEAERRSKGLQFAPRPFDPAGAERPSVFAVAPGRGPMIYQRFVVKGSAGQPARNGMIYAQATSPTRGRILSLALTLPDVPRSPARLTVTGARSTREGCRRDQPVHIYSAMMTAEQLRRLSGTSGCTWRTMAACNGSKDKPRGRVLFVQSSRFGTGYDYRWVDYDLVR